MKWISTLFAAEAIPSAVVTFVAPLMFLQLGAGWGMAMMLCGFLSLPWVLKSFFRFSVQHTAHLRRVLHGVELAIFLLLVGLAFCFAYGRRCQLHVFLCLFVLCIFCAWHELASGIYYERLLPPLAQRLYNGTKMFFSQSVVVLTYGVLIVVVGTLEVFYYNRAHAILLSWSTAVYLLAGLYLLLLIFNLFVLPGQRRGWAASASPSARIGARGGEVCAAARLVLQPRGAALAASLAVLLLPQALMFHTRVLFLLAPRADGGLGCSLQWIGLAQGTVGVIAFSCGLGLGHWLMHHVGRRRWLSRPSAERSLLRTMAFALGLSPTVYWLMTWQPPLHLLTLCLSTAAAQFFFGYGLNCCMTFVRHFSGERYRSTINYLYIPLISLVMLLPMSVSGWLVSRLGFGTFFAVDALSALPAWAAAAVGWRLMRDEIV